MAKKVLHEEKDWLFILDYINAMTQHFGVPAKVLTAINRAELSEVEVKKIEPGKK